MVLSYDKFTDRITILELFTNQFLFTYIFTMYPKTPLLVPLYYDFQLWFDIINCT